MKLTGKKIALGCLAGVLAVAGLTGCSSKIDGTKTVVTVDGEAVPLGVVSFLTRYQQAQTMAMYDMYFGGADPKMWDNVMDEDSGETYGESARSDVLDQVELMYLLKAKSGDYNVEITKKEQKKIAEAAKNFIAANSEETLADLGVTQSDMETVLELQTYEKKMFDPIVKDVDTEVSDEEAQQTSVTYVEVSTAEEAEESGEEEVSESGNEDAEKEEESSPEEKAQKILDEVLATADADMDAIAKDVDENLSAVETHFTANPPEKEDDEEESSVSDTVPQAVQDAAGKLSDGEIAGELIEGEDAYYVVRLDKAFDEEATESEKESIVDQRKQDLYEKTTEEWKDDADIQVDKKVLKSLKVTSNLKFTMKMEEADEAENETEETGEDVSANDISENNVSENDVAEDDGNVTEDLQEDKDEAPSEETSSEEE